MDATDVEQENRREFLRRWVASKGGHAEVVRRFRMTTGQASFLSQVMNGYSFGSRAARNMEQRLGMPPRFLELPPPELGVDQVVSHTPRSVKPQRIEWEQLVAGADLGELFSTEMPDDANAPEYPRGLEVIWSTKKVPQIGSMVILRDQHGALHAREYRQGKAPGHWVAAPSNRAYASFSSEAEPLQIVAVAAFKGVP